MNHDDESMHDIACVIIKRRIRFLSFSQIYALIPRIPCINITYFTLQQILSAKQQLQSIQRHTDLPMFRNTKTYIDIQRTRIFASHVFILLKITSKFQPS